MITTQLGRPAGDAQVERGGALVHAAIRFAEKGWPVLPGSAFDGRRYVVAATYRATDGLRPVLPREAASTDMRTVAQWWRVNTPLVPSVMLRTGKAFDAVSVSRELAIQAVQSTAFRDAPGPVIMRPDQGRAYFLVGLSESVLPPEGARPTVVEPVDAGMWIVAPPTRTMVGGVSWLVPPRVSDWHPACASALAEALRTALSRSESAGWGG
ncbi:MAG: bifunctional DNA primase/polymerase [Haloechinothrix sp.]